MSDYKKNIEFDITSKVDTSDILSQLKKVEQESLRLQKTLFDNQKNTAKEVDNLVAKYKQLARELSKTNDPAQVSKLNNELKSIENQLKDINVQASKNTLDKELKDDTTQAKKLDNSLDKIPQSLKDIKRQAGNVSTSFDKLKSFSEKIFFPVAAFQQVSGAVSSLVRGVTELTDAYAVQQKAEQTLRLALQNSGQEVENNFQQMKAYASEMQGKTIFGDETTLQLMSRFVATGKSVAESQDLMTTAMNVASATGQDLNTVTEQILQGQTGRLTTLTKLLPLEDAVRIQEIARDNTLTDLEKKTQSYNATMEALSRTYSGAAEQQATMDGGVQQLKNTFGDMMENMGKVLLPLVIKITDFLSQLINNISEYFSGLADSTDFSWLEDAASVIKDIFGEIWEVLQPLGTILSTFFSNIKTGFANLSSVLESSGIIDGFVAVWENIKKIINIASVLYTRFSEVFEGITSGVGAVGSIFQPLINMTTEWITMIGDALDWLLWNVQTAEEKAASYDEFTQKIEQQQQALAALKGETLANVSAGDNLNDIIEKASGIDEELANKLKSLVDENGNLTGTTEDVIAVIDDFNESISSTAIEETREQIAGFADDLEDYANNVIGFTDAMEEDAIARQQRYLDSSDRIKQTAQDLLKAYEMQEPVIGRQIDLLANMARNEEAIAEERAKAVPDLEKIAVYENARNEAAEEYKAIETSMKPLIDAVVDGRMTEQQLMEQLEASNINIEDQTRIINSLHADIVSKQEEQRAKIMTTLGLSEDMEDVLGSQKDIYDELKTVADNTTLSEKERLQIALNILKEKKKEMLVSNQQLEQQAENYRLMLNYARQRGLLNEDILKQMETQIDAMDAKVLSTNADITKLNNEITSLENELLNPDPVTTTSSTSGGTGGGTGSGLLTKQLELLKGIRLLRSDINDLNNESISSENELNDLYNDRINTLNQIKSQYGGQGTFTESNLTSAGFTTTDITEFKNAGLFDTVNKYGVETTQIDNLIEYMKSKYKDVYDDRLEMLQAVVEEETDGIDEVSDEQTTSNEEYLKQLNEIKRKRAELSKAESDKTQEQLQYEQKVLDYTKELNELKADGLIDEEQYNVLLSENTDFLREQRDIALEKHFKSITDALKDENKQLSRSIELQNASTDQAKELLRVQYDIEDKQADITALNEDIIDLQNNSTDLDDDAITALEEQRNLLNEQLNILIAKKTTIENTPEPTVEEPAQAPTPSTPSTGEYEKTIADRFSEAFLGVEFADNIKNIKWGDLLEDRLVEAAPDIALSVAQTFTSSLGSTLTSLIHGDASMKDVGSMISGVLGTGISAGLEAMLPGLGGLIGNVLTPVIGGLFDELFGTLFDTGPTLEEIYTANLRKLETNIDKVNAKVDAMTTNFANKMKFDASLDDPVKGMKELNKEAKVFNDTMNTGNMNAEQRIQFIYDKEIEIADLKQQLATEDDAAAKKLLEIKIASAEQTLSTEQQALDYQEQRLKLEKDISQERLKQAQYQQDITDTTKENIKDILDASKELLDKAIANPKDYSPDEIAGYTKDYLSNLKQGLIEGIISPDEYDSIFNSVSDSVQAGYNKLQSTEDELNQQRADKNTKYAKAYIELAKSGMSTEQIQNTLSDAMSLSDEELKKASGADNAIGYIADYVLSDKALSDVQSRFDELSASTTDYSDTLTGLKATSDEFLIGELNGLQREAEEYDALIKIAEKKGDTDEVNRLKALKDKSLQSQLDKVNEIIDVMKQQGRVDSDIHEYRMQALDIEAELTKQMESQTEELEKQKDINNEMDAQLRAMLKQRENLERIGRTSGYTANVLQGITNLTDKINIRSAELNLPQFAEGGYIDRDMIAQVHAGEYVIPSDMVSYIRGSSYQEKTTDANITLNINATGYGANDVVKLVEQDWSVNGTKRLQEALQPIGSDLNNLR